MTRNQNLIEDISTKQLKVNKAKTLFLIINLIVCYAYTHFLISPLLYVVKQFHKNIFSLW